MSYPSSFGVRTTYFCLIAQCVNNNIKLKWLKQNVKIKIIFPQL